MNLGPLTLADLSILGAVAAYMAPIAIAKYGAIGAFDNSRPRDPAFYADPFRARALAAHQNGMEGFAFFAAAVVIAQMRAAPQHVVDGLAVAYVALRFAYAAAYLADVAALRSAVWALAFAANLALIFAPLLRR
ncbi:MAG TPA: MAPEG family protein [Caulobacteraceae bacterium]|jgi:uncharacterized MAPEG superfamily protein